MNHTLPATQLTSISTADDTMHQRQAEMKITNKYSVTAQLAFNCIVRMYIITGNPVD